MENILTIESALTNSNRFVKKVATELYASKSVVTGSELPKMTTIREINFIFIYILLQSWKAETKKIKSPYFNFENEDVKNALEKLMNILSNHIAIERENFEPLLKQSFQLTLLYFKNPITFLNQIFQDKVNTKELKELNKFIKADFVTSIIDFLESNNEYQIMLSEIEPSSIHVPSSSDFLDKLTVFLGISEIENKLSSIPENEFKTNNLNDTFQKNEKTLNDQHSQKTTKTILESHASSKVENILKSIPLNEQFKITNEVFGGMKSVYDSFIEKVEKAPSFAEATLLVDEYVSKNEHLNTNKYLLEMIERKFIS